MIRSDFEERVYERLCPERASGGQIEVLAQVGGNRLELPAPHLRAGMAQPRLNARQEERQPFTLVAEDDLQTGEAIEQPAQNQPKRMCGCFGTETPWCVSQDGMERPPDSSGLFEPRKCHRITGQM